MTDAIISLAKERYGDDFGGNYSIYFCVSCAWFQMESNLTFTEARAVELL